MSGMKERKNPTQVRREVDAALVLKASPKSRRPRRAPQGASSFGSVAEASLPPQFARGWKAAVRAYRRHVAALAEGDRSAFDPAVDARHRLYKLTNSGEIDRGTAEALHDFIEGRGADPLPDIGAADAAGRDARSRAWNEEARRLRDEERERHRSSGLW